MVRKWIAEAARVLRMGGSFYLFGYFRMLSRLLPILEKYGFELRQQPLRIIFPINACRAAYSTFRF